MTDNRSSSKRMSEEVASEAPTTDQQDDWATVSALVRRFRKLPLEGDAGCDKLTDDEWREVAREAINALRDLGRRG